ncbi:hypothetical protein Poli38472_006821 [Pythium oligandrum]|uniref:Non-structural maintenance of chromosomes element 1 homolog n=1 Tax=Pythium oligandrum TaxID=41045 RepID=A0A8K1C596_PYTOL|nr:hypothetical protein Poli38472_006821 [Pythium oligandrum]|eukprot:TMW56811.1 hypothetical protein Poli38472_006821 [Pythium oligandrum]
MTRLTDSDRMLLQRIMAAGAMDEHQVRRVAKKLTGEELSQADVDEMVNNLAANIRALALDIRRSVYDDGKMYVAVVNTSNDALTQFSSNYKPWEIVFLRKAIEEIVESEDGALHESDLVNLRENTTIGEVKELLRKLVGEKWLAFSPIDRDQYTLGPRTYLELIAFLRDLEIRKCAICQFEMLQGTPCSSGKASCSTILHTACLERYEEKGLQYKCPTCKHVIKGSR